MGGPIRVLPESRESEIRVNGDRRYLLCCVSCALYHFGMDLIMYSYSVGTSTPAPRSSILCLCIYA